MLRDVADLGQSSRAPGESLGRVGVVAGVVSNGLLGIRPSVAVLSVGHERVDDRVHAGRLDEAEAAARDLLARYPEVFDGLERLGMVYEARGDRKQAADYYRQAVAFILEHPEGFDGEIPTSLAEQANELDPLPP